MSIRTSILFLITLVCMAAFFLPKSIFAASFNLSPTTGTFPVGSTFEVQIMLDTDKKSINALEMSLSFPPDKLQLVSPSTGQSIISVWTSQPRFNNAEGRLDLQGGVIGGITTSRGLVATVTFRVKGTGQAILRFLDNSKILLNDGLGTDVLDKTSGAVYVLTLPRPQGPIVVSETHPDQNAWYKNTSAVFQWATDFGADGYSYLLSEEPVDVPDDISEGSRTSVAYKNVSNGIHYFHIKALRGGVWGGTTHYAINVDNEPPAEFKQEILPGRRTTRQQPIINFSTTDRLSGLNYYEIKIIPLSKNAGENFKGEPLFVETDSPYIPQTLAHGKYDVIVRAYDKAGNYRDVTEKLDITTAIFSFIGEDGLQLKTNLIVSWPIVWIFLLILLGVLGYAVWKLQGWHGKLGRASGSQNLPDSVQKKLEELQAYRSKYGKIALFLLMFLTSYFVLSGDYVYAQQRVLEPPVIEELSRTIANDEIFYVGGRTKEGETEVIVYLQDLQSGEAYSQRIFSDERGAWFYRHDSFLSPGKYLLWTQGKFADQLSPPSPQMQINVESTAIQIGSTRLSLQFIYLIIILILGVATAILLGFFVYYIIRGRQKERLLHKEIIEAEESIRRGFAVLRKDVQLELASIHKLKVDGILSEELKQREEHLLKDLASVERYIGKEVWDVERAQTSS